MGQIGIPLTSMNPGCNNSADRGPYKIGDLVTPDSGITVPFMRCAGLPPVTQPGATAAPGGALSKSSPWTFTISCTTPGTPNSDASMTNGTITGNVSYSGPTPVLSTWVTAG